MSRAGEEMVLELATLLDNPVMKTAAKDDEKDEKKEDKKEEDKKEEKKEDEKDEKEEKKEDKKEASVMVRVLQDLVKLASELDEIGADDASGLVDDALKVIVDNLEKQKLITADLDISDEDPTEIFEEEEGGATEEELGEKGIDRSTLQEPGKHYKEYAQHEREGVPEGLAMSDFGEADPAEKLLSPENIAKLRELGLDI